eukprot:jgi/Tetstr1/424399/TSEL_014958.t1
MPADEDSSVVPLRIKDFKRLPLHNAKKATCTLVWWLQAKAEVSSKPGFDEFWTTDTSPQYHATFVSILNQIVLDKQARTKRLRFTNSADPVRGRKAIDALPATFLQPPRFRAQTCNEALCMRMKTTEDLTDYENRLNLVRMELEWMDKAPDESTLIVAFIEGLRDEFRTAAQVSPAQAAARQRSYNVEMAAFQRQVELRVLAMPINNRGSRYRILYVADTASPDDNDTSSNADLNAYQPRIDLTHVALERNNTHDLPDSTSTSTNRSPHQLHLSPG